MSSQAEPPDAILALRAAAGDERAFAVLVARHKEPTYRLLRRYLGDSDEAYEAAHEAFIAAWAALKRYDPNRSFPGWLRTIAINKARDRGRKLALRRLFFGSRLVEQLETLEPDNSALDRQDRLDREARLTALDRAISHLPLNLKEPLVLAVFERLSHQDVGAVLGLSAKAVESRIYRAKKALAAALAKDP